MSPHRVGCKAQHFPFKSGGGKGDLATLTYPSGSVLTHQYNATGRLTGMLWAGKPLLQNIVYNALDLGLCRHQGQWIQIPS